jgi:hypothetical protein
MIEQRIGCMLDEVHMVGLDEGTNRRGNDVTVLVDDKCCETAGSGG